MYIQEIMPPHTHVNMHMQYTEESKPKLAFEAMHIFIASKVSSYQILCVHTQFQLSNASKMYGSQFTSKNTNYLI